MDVHKQNYIKALSNFSVCLYPYLKSIQEKYSTQEFLLSDEDVDIKEYCKNEKKDLDVQKEKLMKYY